MATYSISDLTTKRQRLLQSINKFPESKYEYTFYGSWTIKEVITHISAWDIYFTKLLISHVHGKPIDYWGSINDFNAQEVEKRKDMKLDQVINELKLASLKFINTYKQVPKAKLDQKIWPTRSFTPQSILKIQIHHYKSQTKQILKRY